jgi:hypothetical protein
VSATPAVWHCSLRPTCRCLSPPLFHPHAARQRATVAHPWPPHLGCVGQMPLAGQGPLPLLPPHGMPWHPPPPSSLLCSLEALEAVGCHRVFPFCFPLVRELSPTLKHADDPPCNQPPLFGHPECRISPSLSWFSTKASLSSPYPVSTATTHCPSILGCHSPPPWSTVLQGNTSIAVGHHSHTDATEHRWAELASPHHHRTAYPHPPL